MNLVQFILFAIVLVALDYGGLTYYYKQTDVTVMSTAQHSAYMIALTVPAWWLSEYLHKMF